ncbi:hypothetical protein CDD80_2402 [Ophiocordyceps camponoti-rufipedis]|uniref:Uncharacterized protein n=1 Tax=Ophiocordyceps camponoti-rufipedis TaxID=2004952 RepID=A0A2C5Z0Q9_9HYPO|nr:hypothetical protein CDD80_2402 [Ophiocordyceps camponoti-rufipedis]
MIFNLILLPLVLASPTLNRRQLIARGAAGGSSGLDLQLNNPASSESSNQSNSQDSSALDHQHNSQGSSASTDHLDSRTVLALTSPPISGYEPVQVARDLNKFVMDPSFVQTHGINQNGNTQSSGDSGTAGGSNCQSSCTANPSCESFVETRGSSAESFSDDECLFFNAIIQPKDIVPRTDGPHDTLIAAYNKKQD